MLPFNFNNPFPDLLKLPSPDEFVENSVTLFSLVTKFTALFFPESFVWTMFAVLLSQ